MPRYSSPNVISPKEAGRLIGRGQGFVEYCLRTRQFPVGEAVYNEETGRWAYIIPRKSFMEWINHYHKSLPIVIFDKYKLNDSYVIPSDELKNMLLHRTGYSVQEETN